MPDTVTHLASYQRTWCDADEVIAVQMTADHRLTHIDLDTVPPTDVVWNYVATYDIPAAIKPTLVIRPWKAAAILGGKL